MLSGHLRVSITVIKQHDQKKKNGKERMCFIYSLYHSISLKAVRTGTPVRLETGGRTTAEAKEEYCLLGWFSWLSQAGFSDSRTTELGVALASHNGMGPSSSVINQENILQPCLQLDLLEASSQLRLLPLDDFSLCKINVKTNQHNWPRMSSWHGNTSPIKT